MSEEMVEITAARLKSLEHSERILEALEAGGVDNWEWYSDSINMYYPECWADDR